MKKILFILMLFVGFGNMLHASMNSDIAPMIHKVLSVYNAETGETIPYDVYIKRQQAIEAQRHKSPAHKYAHHCSMKNGVRVCHPKKEDCYYSRFGRQCSPNQEFAPGVLSEPVPQSHHRKKVIKRQGRKH
jgi:hypothetical protein